MGGYQPGEARQNRFGELHGEFRAGAVQVPLEDVLDLHAHVGVEVLARHEDEARVEASVEVAADEDARLAPVSQAQDAERGFQQRVLVDLEQLVAGLVLQDREQALVRVAPRAAAPAFSHPAELGTMRSWSSPLTPSSS